jgi:hypothetical protein
MTLISITPAFAPSGRFNETHRFLERLGTVGTPANVTQAGLCRRRDFDAVMEELSPATQVARLANVRGDLQAKLVFKECHGLGGSRTKNFDMCELG